MCGIVGIVGQTKPEIFKDMLFLDTLRGFDSTGAFFVNHHSKLNTIKSAIPGYHFITTKTFNNYLKDKDLTALIGHNRAATKGRITKENAHPFVHEGSKGKIALVHNGTLYNHKNLTKNHFDTDSEAICYLMANESPKDVIKELDGAFCLVWYNTKTKLLYIVRNSQRPLELAWSSDLRTLLFCSDHKMLRMILGKYRITPKNNGFMPIGEIWGIEPSTGKIVDKEKVEFFKYRFDSYKTGNNKNTYEKSPLPWTIYDKYKGKTIEAYVSSIDMYSKRAVLYAETADVDSISVRASIDHKLASQLEELDLIQGTVIGYSTAGNNINLHLSEPSIKILEKYNQSYNSFKNQWIKGPKNIFYSLKEWNEMTKHGCAFCQKTVIASEAEELTWTHDNQPICKGCSDAWRNAN